MEFTRTDEWRGSVTDRYVLANGMVLEHTYYTDSYNARRDGATTKQGAIYVYGAKEPTLFDGILKHTQRGEDREQDAAWDAHNGLLVAYQRDEITKVGEAEDFEELPAQIKDVLTGKLRFSRTAGCSCPCSPGWLGKNRSVLGTAGTLRIDNLENEAESQRKLAERKATLEAAAAN